MKFDVIVGNPPYQAQTDGHGANASPIYQHFVDRAVGLDPRYVLMIVPSRWFAGGKGLDDFRARMISDRRLRTIVDHPVAADCFPGVEIKGGVNYFLWDREHDGDVQFTTKRGGLVVDTMSRDLRGGEGAVIRDNRAASIIEKTRASSSLESLVSRRKPFSIWIMSNYPDSQLHPFPGSVPLVYGTKVGYVRPDQLQRRHEWIDRWKVLLPAAYGAGEGTPHAVLGVPIALAPGSACTDTYLVAGTFDTAGEAENYAHYLCTKLARFLVLQRKITQHVRPEVFRFVPQLDYTRRWTDQDLYEHFGLTEDEREYVESRIQPREPYLSLDSPIPASHLPGGAKYKAQEAV